jgi:hypothetical protein
MFSVKRGAYENNPAKKSRRFQSGKNALLLM